MRNNTALFLLLLTLSACHGVLDDLYDKPIEDDVAVKEGQLYINASSWTDWHYIDLKATATGFVRKAIPTERLENPESPESPTHAPGIYTYWYDVFGAGLSNHEFRSFTPTAPQSDPASWHIAVHRNNVRTNGGSAYETTYTSLDALPESSEAFADASHSACRLLFVGDGHLPHSSR